MLPDRATHFGSPVLRGKAMASGIGITTCSRQNRQKERPPVRPTGRLDRRTGHFPTMATNDEAPNMGNLELDPALKTVIATGINAKLGWIVQREGDSAGKHTRSPLVEIRILTEEQWEQLEGSVFW